MIKKNVIILFYGFIHLLFFSCISEKNSNIKLLEETKSDYLNFVENKVITKSFQDSLLISELVNGIKQENNAFLNVEGYNVYVFQIKNNVEEETLKKIKEHLKIDNDFIKEEDSDSYHFYLSEEIEDNNRSVYVFPLNLNYIIVEYRTPLKSNKRIENEMNNFILSKQFKDFNYLSMQVDSIKFAGRYIPLGAVCSWNNVNNIRCDRLGQISWSEFLSPKRAKDLLIKSVENSQKQSSSKLEKTDIIDIQFEGVNSKALRNIHKIGFPSIILGGSNSLYTYHILEKINGRYIVVNLSHYEDEIIDNELPALINEVMKIK